MNKLEDTNSSPHAFKPSTALEYLLETGMQGVKDAKDPERASAMIARFDAIMQVALGQVGTFYSKFYERMRKEASAKVVGSLQHYYLNPSLGAATMVAQLMKTWFEDPSRTNTFMVMGGILGETIFSISRETANKHHEAVKYEGQSAESSAQDLRGSSSQAASRNAEEAKEAQRSLKNLFDTTYQMFMKMIS